MNLRQQIIEDQVFRISRALNINEDEAFLRFVHSLVVGRSIHAFDPADIVDGGQDKQIDAFTIEEAADGTDVFLIQAKNSGSFSSNSLIQMGNGLQWVFERPRRELAGLANQALRDKIIEYRSVQNDIGPANIRVHCYFVTTGQTREISDEFRQELRAIQDRFVNGVFESFDFQPLGSDELVSLLRAVERRERRVDGEMKIRYDTNNPSLIRYHSQDLKGLVCTVPAQEIARLVNADDDGSIFDLNLRRFLGTRGAVNAEILATCSSTESSYEFWFLNNGVTIVCDRFDAVPDPDNPHVKLTNMQIVNGCQTATTLALAHREGSLAPDVRVLVRIYETNNPDLVGKIVLTTNNQNKISSRDLRANDVAQAEMEAAFRIFGYYYERKARQFAGTDLPSDRIVANEAVAQWYLAVVLRNPADARGRKYKIWGEHYTQIFTHGRAEPYVIAALLGRCVTAWLRDSGHTRDEDDIRRMLAKRGAFHIGRVAAFLWRGSDEWRGNPDMLAPLIPELDGRCDTVSPHIRAAFDVLEGMIRGSTEFAEDIDRTLKSYSFDEAIHRELHTRHRRTAT